jgi:hypothetical protein
MFRPRKWNQMRIRREFRFYRREFPGKSELVVVGNSSGIRFWYSIGIPVANSIGIPNENCFGIRREYPVGIPRDKN